MILILCKHDTNICLFSYQYFLSQFTMQLPNGLFQYCNNLWHFFRKSHYFSLKIFKKWTIQLDISNEISDGFYYGEFPFFFCRSIVRCISMWIYTVWSSNGLFCIPHLWSKFSNFINLFKVSSRFWMISSLVHSDNFIYSELYRAFSKNYLFRCRRIASSSSEIIPLEWQHYCIQFSWTSSQISYGKCKLIRVNQSNTQTLIPRHFKRLVLVYCYMHERRLRLSLNLICLWINAWICLRWNVFLDCLLLLFLLIHTQTYCKWGYFTVYCSKMSSHRSQCLDLFARYGWNIWCRVCVWVCALRVYSCSYFLIHQQTIPPKNGYLHCICLH